MVQLVLPHLRTYFRREIDAMHRLRYDIVVRRWGWKIPGIPADYDKDEFDTDSTLYFLAFSPGGEHVVGCGRLNPTTAPHMLSEVFPGLCNIMGVRRGPQIYEFSRFVVDGSNLSREAKRQVIGKIEFAITKFCLAAGITHLTWVSNKGVFRHGAEIWRTRALGRPAVFDADQAAYIAAISEIDDGGLDRIRAIFRFSAIEPPCVLRSDWAVAADLFKRQAA